MATFQFNRNGDIPLIIELGEGERIYVSGVKVPFVLSHNDLDETFTFDDFRWEWCDRGEFYTITVQGEG